MNLPRPLRHLPAWSIRKRKDCSVGAFYLLVGAVFSLKAYISYEVGSPQAMGPGFFPFWLGLILAALGAGLIMQSVVGEPQALPSVSWLTLAIILAAILLFGLLIERLGLAVALFAMVGVASVASHEFRWRRTLVCALVITIFCSVLFIELLGLQLPLWPAR